MSTAPLQTRDVADMFGVSERHARRLGSGRVVHDGDGIVRRKYDLASLPPDIQVQWAQRNNVIPMTPAGAPGQLALSLTVPVGPNLSEEDRIEVEKRYRVIEPLIKPDQFVAIWAQHKNSRVAVIDWLAKQHKTKRRTLYTWLAAWRQGGLPALIPKDRSDKGKPKMFNPAALDFILAAAFPKHGAYGKLTVRDIFRAYGEERAWRAANIGKPLDDCSVQRYARYVTSDGCLAPSAQLPEASYGTFRNWFDRIPEIAKTMAREGDEAFHNTQEILSFRSFTDVKPLDYVVMDHRRLDLFCLIPERGGWKLARPWLTAAIDMRTRKWLGWVICETPSSDSIAATLKKVFLKWGLPVACYWDNGKDFRCEWLEGGRIPKSETRGLGEMEIGMRGVLGTLGIRVHHAIVRRARAKLIEPNFGRTGDFDRTTPWWCGHNPMARPSERFDKLLNQHERWLAGADVEPAFPTIAQVAALYDDCLNDLNERSLEGEGMNKVTPTGRGWMCPNEAWELLIPQVPKRLIPEDTIHLCFAKRKELSIRNGEIKATFSGKLWHYRLIGNPQRLMALNGCTIQIAYDPLDLETVAVYYENRFQGLAACIELRHMGEDSFVEDEKLRQIARRETKAFITRTHEQVYVPDHNERHARRTVEPRREPARQIVAAKLPQTVVEAAAALAEEAAAPKPIVVEKVAAAEPAATDDTFDFFQ